MVQEKKSTNHIFRFILIFILAFIVLPLGLGVLLYQTNDDFMKQANKYMSKGPGLIGDYFNKYPTEQERSEKIKYIAEHYSTLDEASVADKLYIIKEKDEDLYFDIISKMKQLPNRGLNLEEAIKLVRNIELRKNTLVSTFDEVKKETQSFFEEEIENLEKIETSLAIDKIKLDYVDTSENHISLRKKGELIAILDHMNEKKAAEILFYLDDTSIKKDLLTSLPSKKSETINQLIHTLETEDVVFKNRAKLYETKNPSEAFLDIGNEEKYTLDDLSKLYYYMDVEKSADILVQSDDNAFIEALLKQLSDFEVLKKGQTDKVLSLSNKITEKRNYISQVEDLSVIYEKIDNRELVNLLEKMMLTDSGLASDILRRMKKTTVAEVLKMMDPRKAIQLSRSLAN